MRGAGGGREGGRVERKEATPRQERERGAGEEAEGIKIKTEVDFRTIRIVIKTNQGSCRITSNLLSVMAGLRATRTNLKGSEVKVKDFSKTKLKGF